MTKEEGQAHMQKWKAWIAAMGDAVVDPGIALGPSKTVGRDGSTDGGGPNPLSGITIITAQNIEGAMELAAQSPHLDIGGTIEVAQDMELPM